MEFASSVRPPCSTYRVGRLTSIFLPTISLGVGGAPRGITPLCLSKILLQSLGEGVGVRHRWASCFRIGYSNTAVALLSTATAQTSRCQKRRRWGSEYLSNDGLRGTELVLASAC